MWLFKTIKIKDDGKFSSLVPLGPPPGLGSHTWPVATESDGENAERAHGRGKFCWASRKPTGMHKWLGARESHGALGRDKELGDHSCLHLATSRVPGPPVSLRPLLMGTVCSTPSQLLGALRRESWRSFSGWPAREHRIGHRSFTAYRLDEPGDEQDLEVRLCELLLLSGSSPTGNQPSTTYRSRRARLTFFPTRGLPRNPAHPSSGRANRLADGPGQLSGSPGLNTGQLRAESGKCL